jgi:hypothetical protein
VPRKFVPPLRGSKQFKKNLNCGSYPGLTAWASRRGRDAKSASLWRPLPAGRLRD